MENAFYSFLFPKIMSFNFIKGSRATHISHNITWHTSQEKSPQIKVYISSSIDAFFFNSVIESRSKTSLTKYSG